jgi:hypothetical protein
MVFKTGTKVIVNDKGVNKVAIILRKSYHSSLQGYRYKVMLEGEIIHYKAPLLTSDVKDKPLFYLNKELSEFFFSGNKQLIKTRLSLLEGNIQRNKWNIDYRKQLATEATT